MNIIIMMYYLVISLSLSPICLYSFYMLIYKIRNSKKKNCPPSKALERKTDDFRAWLSNKLRVLQREGPLFILWVAIIQDNHI